MGSPVTEGELAARVDCDRGVISREIFVDPDIYQMEQERLFARAWLFLGHESQIRKPGDYFVSRMGEEAVIVARDRQGAIHAFLNTCRHRGMKVCRYDEGNTPIFSCPYHGWSYALDGSLVGVPHYRDAYFQELDKSRWGLHPVARLGVLKGSLWATWHPDAPTLEEYLGPLVAYIEEMFTAHDGVGEVEILGGVQKSLLPCNWKFRSENGTGDLYHNISHISVDAVGIGPGGRTQGRHGHTSGRGRPRGFTAFPALGHTLRGSPPAPGDADGYPFPPFEDPQVEAYYRSVYEVRRRQPGRWPPLFKSGGGFIFPGMCFFPAFPRSIAVPHPGGPLQTEVWRWFVVDEDAPQHVKDVLRRYMIRYAGPGGMTEQDDFENWNYATAASRGVIARRLGYNYQLGLGHSQRDGGLPGAEVSEHPMTEANALAFYRRWLQFMTSERWPLSEHPAAGAGPV